MEKKAELILRAGQVFTPAAPIDKKDFFAGRMKELVSVLDSINQKGQHAVVFGERGVGKTSLANMLAEFLTIPQGYILAPHVNCDIEDTYTSLWRKILSEIDLYQQRRSAGFQAELSPAERLDLEGQLPEKVTTGDIRRILAPLASEFTVVLIVDEVDRLAKGNVRTMMADTIKMMSDRGLSVTMVLVGVADSVEELILGHESIERNLVQVALPRMSPDELLEIVEKGLERLGMTIDASAADEIVGLSKGLPHYTHLLGKHAARSALQNGKLAIGTAEVESAIDRALEDVQQSIRARYYRATSSQRSDALYRQVLLACAMAATDEMGFFSPVDVRGPMTEIMGRPYDTPNFAKHLGEFSSSKRSEVLQKVGESHRFRYRFRNPLMQPFVLMQGFAEGLIDLDQLRAALR